MISLKSPHDLPWNPINPAVKEAQVMVVAFGRPWAATGSQGP